MSSPTMNTRRRTQRSNTPSPAALRKSETFSPRTGLRSKLVNPCDNAPCYPRRSPTTLEDLVLREEDLIAARQNMVAKYLQDVDDAIRSDSPDAGIDILNDNQVLAIPELMVNQVIVPDPMAIDEKKPHEADHQHGSDSGIGDSVDTPQIASRSFASARSSAGSVFTTHSAITRSFSAQSSLPQNTGSDLSREALQLIKDKILTPILNDEKLKAYHPLIKSIPSQVDSNFISNLRDLEKTLVYETPRFSPSANSFIKFWELSIQCLHTTVDHLTDRDQRRETDRPYTNNYFLDLVEQIRRYAEIMARTRQKKEKGEDLDEMDYSPDEKITLQGGLSHDGKPAQLVRQKDGKSVSLLPEGAQIDDTMSISSKRRLADDDWFEDDDDVLRSMARRRKSDKAGDVIHTCPVCQKEFKRPCDLTKHEKTHSRPFKCTHDGCFYASKGWPTEKELERHMNDKHSSQPKMYRCNFPPCSYSSKRESNCKQHMEKAHGWTYVRSKSNGRKKSTGTTGSLSMTPSTPFSNFDQSPITGPTPESTSTPSPWWQTENAFNFGEPSIAQYNAHNRRDSTTTAATNFTYSSGFSPEQMQAALHMVPSTEKFDFNSPLFVDNSGVDFDGMTNMAYQQPTPALSNDADFDLEAALQPVLTGVDPAVVAAQQAADQVSPLGDVSLYSPVFNLEDEGYAEDAGRFNEDFLLFPSNTTMENTASQQAATAWYPDMAMGGVFDNNSQFNLENGSMFQQ